MKKRLIAISLALAVCMPLTAQATAPTDWGFSESNLYSKQVVTTMTKATMQPEEPSYALKAPSGDAGKLIAIGAGSGGLFDSDPATVVAANDNCGSCHSANRDVPSGASGGGSRAGITTS